MLEKLQGKEFEYRKLTEEEQKTRGILGRLIGPCADFKNPTRNDRRYVEQLWDNVFSNPIMKEKIANKCCFGELGHPEDRSSVDMEKIAINLAEFPKKGADGKLYAVFDILNTPNGKILKALCDYGCKIGISSRGQGDVDEFDNSVDPNTYECECFDAVIVPGVEAARLKYVTEDYKPNKKLNLKSVLAESLKNANESERKVMIETIETLNLTEEIRPEIKLSDCIKLTSAEQASEITKELGAKWIFGSDDSLGVNVGEKYFEMFNKNMDLYVYKKGDKSVCFGIKSDGTIYGPFDVYDKNVGVNILVTLNDVELIDESLIEDKDSDLDLEKEKISEEENELSLSDLSLEEPEEEIDAPEEEVEDKEEEVEDKEEEVDSEECEIDEEQIFLDFLASNFEEDQVRKVCKLLNIEIEGDEDTPENDETDEESVDNDASKEEETPEEEIDVDQDETNEVEEPVEEAIDDGSKTLVNSLKETLKIKSDLENNVKSLQEKLAVSDAKVNEINEECNKYKEAVARLSLLAKSSKDLKEKMSELEESLKQKTAVIQTQKVRIARLAESSNSMVEKSKLTEDVVAKTAEIKKLNESLEETKAEYSKQITALNNQLNESKSQTESKIKALTENVNKMTNIKESYRKLANKAVNKYIEIKSETLGLTSTDIKRKLGESYTLEDVDQVCEDLKQYQLNVSKLPFSLDRQVAVRVNESRGNALNVIKQKSFTDDDVDESLLRLANFTD
ncbi:MAG: hypothetical protein M0Q88_00330 [Bacilli bacterium]|nr:hypothetical protein [Bacilli bacterium]